jgi:ABC-type transporter Mla subunit MlaD
MATAAVSTGTAHLREECERRLERLRQAGETPDPRTAQINRLKNEVAELTARLAAQHEEITRLRSALSTPGKVFCWRPRSPAHR